MAVWKKKSEGLLAGGTTNEQCSESKHLHPHVQDTQQADTDFIFKRQWGRAFVERKLCHLQFAMTRSAKGHLLGLPASYGNNLVIKDF